MSPRDEARELLRELLHEALAAGGNGGSQSTGGHSTGGRPTGGHSTDGPPAVPGPPVAAVLRPSTWDRPAAPGEVIGDGAARGDVRGAEPVTIGGDDDLDRFVRALAARCADPAEREAIRTGRVRFMLGGAQAPGAGALRVERAAVTERTVAAAAAAGQRIVLGPGAVPTPLAREKARALGIRIERETRC